MYTLKYDIIANENAYVSMSEKKEYFHSSETLKLNGNPENAKEIYLSFATDNFPKEKIIDVKLGFKNAGIEPPEKHYAEYIDEKIDFSLLNYENSTSIKTTGNTAEFDLSKIKKPPFYCNINSTPWVYADVTEIVKENFNQSSHLNFKVFSDKNTATETIYHSNMCKEDLSAPYMDIVLQTYYKPRLFITCEIDASTALQNEIIKAENLLNDTKLGDDIWEYTQENRNKLEQAVSKAKLATGNFDSKINEIKNAIDAYIKNINIPTIKRPSLFYSESDLPKIRERIDNINDLNDKYMKIKTEVDSYDMDSFAKMFALPRWDGFLNFVDRQPFVFTAPENAVTAKVQILVKGTADILIDDAIFSELTGATLDSDNMNFEKGTTFPDNWIAKTNSNTSNIEWYSKRCFSGTHCMHVVNTDVKDIATLEYLLPFNITSGVRYKFNCQLNYAEFLSDATYLQTTFFDENGEIISTVTSVGQNQPHENRPTEVKDRAMYSSIVYMKEGTKHYAIMAKNYLDMMMNSLLNVLVKINTGYYWSFFHTIGVQTIHTAQFFAQISIMFDMLESSGAYTKEEKDIFKNKMWQAMYIMKNDLSFVAHHHNNRGNMNCSRGAALAIGAIVLKDDYRAREYYNYGLSQIKLVMNENFRHESDGSWKETENYNWSVMDILFVMGIAMQRDNDLNTQKEDLFFYKDVLTKNMNFLVSIPTPIDVFNTLSVNSILFPGIGDSGWINTNKFYFLAYAYKNSDPELAAKLMISWERAGKQIIDSDYDILPFVFIDYDIPTDFIRVEDFVKSKKFDGRGYLIFRQNVGKSYEDYVLMTYTNMHDGHGHSDVGGLSIYLKGIPVGVDPSVDGYSNGNLGYYTSAVPHNLVTFNDITAANGTISDENFFTSSKIDTAILDFEEIENVTSNYQRHIAFVKSGFDNVVIWDDTQVNSNTKTVFKMGTITTKDSVKVEGNKFIGTSLPRPDMEIEILALEQDENFDYEIERIKNPAKGFPRDEEFSFQNYFKVNSTNKNAEFLSIINLKKSGTNGINAEKLDTGNENVTAYKIFTDDDWYILVINRSNEKNSIKLPIEQNLTNLETEITYNNALVDIPAKKMIFLK